MVLRPFVVNVMILIKSSFPGACVVLNYTNTLKLNALFSVRVDYLCLLHRLQSMRCFRYVWNTNVLCYTYR